jgi:phosphate-selective porin OprO and OprP
LPHGLESSLGQGARPGQAYRFAGLFLVCVFLHSLRAQAASPEVKGAVPTGQAEEYAPGQGPARLRQHVQLKIETNAPAPATNASPKRQAILQWRAKWRGWDGLHLELARKTWLGQLVPGVTNVGSLRLDDVSPEPLQDQSPSEQSKASWLNLEESRLAAKIGGKLALDAAAYVTSQEFTGFDDGGELRRARLYAKGDCLLVMPVSYQIEIGYVPNQFYIEESYLVLKNLPWIGDLKGGQYQAPMGLDVITSSRDITFMEPAAPMQALAPGVNAGIQMGRPVLGQRATWAFGLFTDGVGDDFGEATKDYGRVMTRLTGLPVYHVDPSSPNSQRLLHLGLSANLLYSASSAVRYRSRPESHLAPYVIDTGDIAADGALVVGAEAAWVHGPFSVQGEYLHSWVHEEGGQVPMFDGLYASASWLLTGESRPYDRTEGKFGRVIPKHHFDFGHGGWGAWEVAGRYSFVNLNSGRIEGGRLSMLMAGLNWHPHANIKWRFDYGFGHVSGRQPDGNINVFQTRVEVDF